MFRIGFILPINHGEQARHGDYQHLIIFLPAWPVLRGSKSVSYNAALSKLVVFKTGSVQKK
jgi:hypothetical protein